MPVRSRDMLCRFIPGHSNHWSTNQGRPRPPAFKDNDGLSVWHIVALLENSVFPEQLRVGGLEGHGQAHHTAGDYVEAARRATQSKGVHLAVEVEWRVEDRYVKPDWRRWAYAHVQVEYVTDYSANAKEQESVSVFFRQLLSKNAHHIIPPDRYKQ